MLTHENPEFVAAHRAAFNNYKNVMQLEPYTPAIGEIVYLMDWHDTAVVVNVDNGRVDVLIIHMKGHPLHESPDIMEDYPKEWIRTAEFLN